MAVTLDQPPFVVATDELDHCPPQAPGDFAEARPQALLIDGSVIRSAQQLHRGSLANVGLSSTPSHAITPWSGLRCIAVPVRSINRSRARHRCLTRL